MNPDDEEFQPRNALSSSFRTFDAINYQVYFLLDFFKKYLIYSFFKSLIFHVIPFYRSFLLLTPKRDCLTFVLIIKMNIWRLLKPILYQKM